MCRVSVTHALTVSLCMSGQTLLLSVYPHTTTTFKSQHTRWTQHDRSISNVWTAFEKFEVRIPAASQTTLMFFVVFLSRSCKISSYFLKTDSRPSSSNEFPIRYSLPRMITELKGLIYRQRCYTSATRHDHSTQVKHQNVITADDTNCLNLWRLNVICFI